MVALPKNRKATGLFEARFQETRKHPGSNYSLSHTRSVELASQLLEKEWTWDRACSLAATFFEQEQAMPDAWWWQVS